MACPRRDSRQQNGIKVRALSQLTSATKSAKSRHQLSRLRRPFTRRTWTRSTGLRQAQALVAQGRRALGRNHLRHNRRNPPSIYAHRMRQLFPKLRLCPIL